MKYEAGRTWPVPKARWCVIDPSGIPCCHLANDVVLENEPIVESEIADGKRETRGGTLIELLPPSAGQN